MLQGYFITSHQSHRVGIYSCKRSQTHFTLGSLTDHSDHVPGISKRWWQKQQVRKPKTKWSARTTWCTRYTIKETKLTYSKTKNRIDSQEPTIFRDENPGVGKIWHGHSSKFFNNSQQVAEIKNMTKHKYQAPQLIKTKSSKFYRLINYQAIFAAQP